MDNRPTGSQHDIPTDAAPASKTVVLHGKQPPDQKTIDALLLVTRTEHDERYRQKAGDMDNVPKGMVAGYIGRKAHAFSPTVLNSSAGARWSAVLLVIIAVVSVILAFVL